MKYTVHVHPDHVEAIVSGAVDVVDGNACVDEAFRLCRQHGLSKIMVNGLGLAENVSIGSRFSLGEHLGASATQRVRVAILTSTKLVRESKALQNTANNRGGQVITTDSLDEARAFLGIAAS